MDGKFNLSDSCFLRPRPYRLVLLQYFCATMASQARVSGACQIPKAFEIISAIPHPAAPSGRVTKCRAPISLPQPALGVPRLVDRT
jgi:hypothetical protein